MQPRSQFGMKFIQADTSSGCWSLPDSGKKKPLWEIPSKRKVGGPGSAFFSLEEVTTGRRSLRGLVVDVYGRIYGPRKCDRPKPVDNSCSLQGMVSLGKRVKATTTVQVFERADGTFAMVEVLMLNEIPEQFRVIQEPERVAASPAFTIPVHQAPPMLLPLLVYPEQSRMG